METAISILQSVMGAAQMVSPTEYTRILATVCNWLGLRLRQTIHTVSHGEIGMETAIWIWPSETSTSRKIECIPTRAITSSLPGLLLRPNGRSVAWGDWDQDSDLDIAVGSNPVRVFSNTSTSLQLAWSSPEMGYVQAVAWGDWDGDEDLDLAVGNGRLGQPNRVYTNIGNSLQLAWSSPDIERFTAECCMGRLGWRRGSRPSGRKLTGTPIVYTKTLVAAWSWHGLRLSRILQQV